MRLVDRGVAGREMNHVVGKSAVVKMRPAERQGAVRNTDRVVDQIAVAEMKRSGGAVWCMRQQAE